MRFLAAAALVALLLAGCGGEAEREFTPQELVAAINAHGAAVQLGDVVTENEDGVAIYTVRFTEPAVGVTGEGSATSALHGSGSLLTLEDAAAAREEYERCSGAPSLTCFRAANAVLRFEDLEPADQARLVTALEAIETVSG